MAEPCKQEGPIAAISATLESVQKTQESQMEIHKETLRVLSTIAVQGEQINTMVRRQDKAEQDTQELFGRMRSTEFAVVDLKNYQTSHTAEHVAADKVADSEHKKSDQFWTPLKVLLVGTAIIAAVTFGLRLLDAHNYTQAPPVPQGK